MTNALITVFTPTFNREAKLKELYASLCLQTDKRFVWLIVDDGSVDNTLQLIKAWEAERKVSIKHIHQENQGKHVAHNTGVMNTDTEFFFCVDSDDELPEDAIACIYKEICDIRKRSDIAGLVAKKAYHGGGSICTEFPCNVKEVSLRTLYKVYKFKGELAMVFKTEVLKKYLFPIFHNEKFLGEDAIINLISINYKMKLMDKVIYLAEYQTDGYSKNIRQVHKKNPMGYLYCLIQEIKLAETEDQLKHAYASYICGCWRVGYTARLDYKKFIVNCPEAMVLYMKKLIKERIAKSDILQSKLTRILNIKSI